MKLFLSRWLGIMILAALFIANVVTTKATGREIPHFEGIFLFFAGGFCVYHALRLRTIVESMNGLPMEGRRELIFNFLYQYASLSGPILQDLHDQQMTNAGSPLEDDHLRRLEIVRSSYERLKDRSGVPDELKSLMKRL